MSAERDAVKLQRACNVRCCPTSRWGSEQSKHSRASASDTSPSSKSYRSGRTTANSYNSAVGLFSSPEHHGNSFLAADKVGRDIVTDLHVHVPFCTLQSLGFQKFAVDQDIELAAVSSPERTLKNVSAEGATFRS